MADQSRRYAISMFQPNDFPNSFPSVYTSAPFKFIVDGKPLYIHADLVSRHSKPLDRMINGPMAEAHEGVATLEDVDHGTFVRFIEWAHKGYYNAAEFTTAELESSSPSGSQNHEEVAPAPQEKDIPEPAPAPEDDWARADVAEPEPEDYGWNQPVQHYGKTKKGRKDDLGTTAQGIKERLRKAFINRPYTVRQAVVETPSPRPNENPVENYTDVFLSHAQLYVFAEKYDIQSLRVLALEELHATLANYTLHPVCTGDIIALLRYVYANTRKPREGVEVMRTMMVQYVLCEMDVLMKDPDFGNLMIEDQGDFVIDERRDLVGDFMKMVAKRISSNV